MAQPSELRRDSRRRVWVTALAVLAVALVLGLLIGIPWVLYWAIAPQSAAERNEFTRTVAQVYGALALAAGLAFTWLTLRETQKANRERERLTEEGNITDRFTQAIEQLGATDSAGKPRLELRLGGIYALQRIARDSERDHWPIMQILTAYLRTNAPFKPTDFQQLSLALAEGRGVEWLREHRPRADIEAIAQVFLNRGRSLGNGEPLSFELTHCDLQGVQFFQTAGIHFEWSNFSFSNLAMAGLSFAKLPHANFNGANLGGIDLQGAELQHATFQGSNLIAARLMLANLEDADFAGANLQGANFERARLHGTNLEAAGSLQGTRLYGASGLTDEQRCACGMKGATIEASAG